MAQLHNFHHRHYHHRPALARRPTGFADDVLGLHLSDSVILNLGYALSPLLIGFMALPALKHIGNRYLLNLVGVLLWPLGWAVAALVTQGMPRFHDRPKF